MRLWTFQPIEVYEILKNKGIYRCDPNNNGVDKYLIKSYIWLVSEMEKRIGKRPNGVKLPIWAWHTTYWKHNKPDLRHVEFKCSKPCLLMEIEIPDNQVVLTDFDAWHFVLNHWYLGKSTCEAEHDKEQAWLDTLTNKQRNIEIIKSWQRVFDISKYSNEWFSRGMFIQATFWELKLSQVKKIYKVRSKVEHK